MHFTAQEAYGLRCILRLARNEDEGVAVTAKQISEYEEISLDYVHKLLGILKRKGLIKSRRGIRGGFLLGRDSSEVTVREVLDHLSSSLNADGHCAKFMRDDDSCPHLDDCEVKPFWDSVRLYYEELGSKVTLHDLLTGNLPKVEVKFF